MSVLLELRQLAVSFATDDGTVRAVDGIDLSLERGRTLGLVGESGCGKSVTSLAVMGLLPPENSTVKGEVRFEGRDLLTLDADTIRDMRGARLAMIFQEPMTSLNPAYTVGDQIIEAIQRHQGLSAADARTRAIEMLRTVRIPSTEKRVDDYPHKLSGGMRQREIDTIDSEHGAVVGGEADAERLQFQKRWLTQLLTHLRSAARLRSMPASISARSKVPAGFSRVGTKARKCVQRSRLTASSRASSSSGSI